MSDPLKAALQARAPLWGCWLTLAAPAAAEALSHAGFDFLVVDTEHSPADGMDVVAQLQAIGNGTARPVVRVTDNTPWMVKRAMDAGCATILFPSVNSADEARRAVAATRYPQGGNGGLRGVAGITRAARYGRDREYVLQANDAACAIVQIETAAGLAAVDVIAAVEGVDALFVGPADLSASLGHLGNPAHPQVQAAIEKIAHAAAHHRKAAGIFAAGAEQALGFAELGFTFIALAADVVWLLKGASDALARARSMR
jgi:2-dehydro-3-deoxyglucarate aldolase